MMLFDKTKSSAQEKVHKCLICGNTAETIDGYGAPLCYTCFLTKPKHVEDNK